MIPTASSGADRAGMWLQECAARARENGLFLIGVNKGGTEIFLDQEGQEHRNHYFGLSCAFNPRGEEVVPPLNDGPWQALRVEVDFSQVEETRSILNFLADYRPQLYQRYNTGPLLEEVQIVRQTELNRETEPLFMPRQRGGSE